MKPGFLNPEGYDIVKVRDVPYARILTKAIYKFTLENPALTFVHPDGRFIQPGKEFETDQGTVPKLGQIFIPKDRYLGFYLHDFGCGYGYLWVSNDGGQAWGQQKFTRAEMDTLLRLMCEYDPDPGRALSRWVVYIGVRIGAFLGIGGKRVPPAPPRFPITLV